MLLNTLNKECLYNSVAEIISVPVQLLENFIKKNALEILENRYDEHTIEKMNLNSIIPISFVGALRKLDQIVIHHISPRENPDSIKKEGIMTLPNVLTKKTILSEYLLKLGYEFEFIANQIHMKKNGEYVDISKLQFSNLLMRLGGKFSLHDFNVNGYLFKTRFQIADCRGWLGSPEILKSISCAYGDNSIADDYAERCNNYLVSFKVPIEQIDIEGFNDNITNEKKVELLIKYSINMLAHLEISFSHIEDMYNPIIMLKRNFDVSGESVVKIWDLELKNSIVEPKERKKLK